MTDAAAIAVLEHKVEQQQKAMEGLEELLAKIEERDSKRVRAGIVLLGTGVLTLMSTVGGLIVYIWKTMVG